MDDRIGHSCKGGGAAITNSPINIHIHIHANEITIAQKIGRAIYAIIGQKSHTIENASQLSEQDLQGSILRGIENG